MCSNVPILQGNEKRRILNCRFVSISVFILIFLLSSALYSSAQEIPLKKPTQDDYIYDFRNKEIFLDIECHSGTPPVLEFVLKDWKQLVEMVYFDFQNDGVIDLEIEPLRGEKDKEKVVFRGAPYRKAGVYNTAVYLKTEYGTFLREYVIGFTDFVWGKDNFSFANDGKFENSIDFVSDTTMDWAQHRFGEFTQEQGAVLLYVMYSIYKGSIGRCYGFSGGEVYYKNNPGRLKYPYINTFGMVESDKRIIKEMDYAQNDIVFSNFISGKIDLSAEQNNESLREELYKLKSSINNGETIILGYLSKKMHHSMAAYGYFENLFRDSVTLLVANNWERDQKDNSFSEDAENIVIQFTGGSNIIKWYDLSKKKYRYPKMVFSIERKLNYDFSREDFLNLVGASAEEIIKDDRMIIMVEKTEHAYLVDSEGNETGYKKPRTFKKLDEVVFRKIDYNYIFEFPKGNDYTLILKKRRYNKEKKMHKSTNLFFIIPEQGKIKTLVFNNLKIYDDTETHFQIKKDEITQLDTEEN
jgi:hypothetical protein